MMQRTWKQTLSLALAVACAVTFALLMPVTLLARSATSVLFSPQVMTEVLQTRLSLRGDVQTPILGALIAGDTSGDGLGDLAQAFAFLDEAEQSEILAVLVPQSWLDSQIEGAVGQAYAWLDTADPYPTIRFDMQPVKLHMLDAGVQAALERIVDSWPPCTGEDLAVFAGNLLGGSPEMVYCSPPGALRDLVLGFLLAGFKEAVGTMPAEMVLTPGSRQLQEMQELKDTLLTWRGLGQWGWMVPVLLLLAILGLQVRSLAAWGRWWGWPLLAAGILALALVVAGASLLQLWGERLVASPILRPVATWIRALLADVSGEILARQLTGGLVLVILGAALLSMVWILRRRLARRSGQPPAAAEATGTRPTGMFG